MKRRLFLILSTFSLLLCLASIALWARSHWAEDELSCEHTSEQNAIRTWRTWKCSTRPGGIWFHYDTGESHYTASIPPGFQMPTFRWTSIAGEELRKQQEDQRQRINELRKRASLPRLANNPLVLTPRFPYYWGFDYRHHIPRSTPRSTQFSYMLSIPYWPFVLCTSLLPTLWLLQIRRHRRRLGLCPTCAYDLRASTTRCPECGSPIPDTSPRPISPSNNP